MMVCINCPLCCKHELESFSELKKHLIHYAEGLLECPLCIHTFTGLQELISHLNTHDSEREQGEESKNVCNVTQFSENGINAGTKMEIGMDITSTCAAIKCEEADLEQYNEQLENDDVEKSQDCTIEQISQNKNDVTNLNSVDLESDSTSLLQINSEASTHWSGSEAKEDSFELFNNVNYQSQYTCGMCEINFETMDLLEEHASNIHGIKYIVIDGSSEDNSMRKQSEYVRVNSTESQLESHKTGKLKKKTSQQQYHLPQLRRILPKPTNPQMLDVNCSVKGVETCRIECGLCGKQFEHQNRYDIHKYIHMNRKHWPLQCSLCQKHFITKGAYHRHLLSVHNIYKDSSPFDGLSKSVQCGLCAKRYRSNGHLKRHIHVHHKALENVPAKPMKCEQCDKLCLSDRDLQRHVDRIHLRVRRCLCTVCGKKFFDSSALKAHSKTHWEVKPFSCSYCDKRFTDSFEVKRHERGHTGEKPHVCEVCGKTFRQGYFLNVHLRSHTGEKPYSCNVCGAAFTCKSTLRNHKLTHVDVKAFKCAHCGKLFRTAIQLYNHERLHTRPFKCEICSKGFSSRIILSKHVRTHEKDYNCQKCGNQFTALHKLNKHERECCVV